MQNIEPFFNWRDKYTAETDKHSPFYKNSYNEFVYDKKMYNYYIHPQWDSIESEDLYVKLLFANYNESYAIIELFGVWNDAIENDAELLFQNLLYPLLKRGIVKFILIAENLLDFHSDITDAYEEFVQELQHENGWIALFNMRQHVEQEMNNSFLNDYMYFGEFLNDIVWRKYQPEEVFERVNNQLTTLLI